MPGYALVDRPLNYRVKKGSNRISAGGIPQAMDVEAVTLRPQAAGVTVASQRFVAPPAGSADVLAVAIGRKVAVEHTAGGTKQTDSGTLLAANDGLTLALADGRIKVIADYDNFSIIQADGLLPQRATLQWTVDAAQTGNAGFLLSYPMGGMAWRAEYLATLAGGEGCTLALDGAALVANRSGVTFDDARVTLIAGEPNRVQRNAEYYAADAAAAAPMMRQMASPMPEHRTSGEYHAYALPGTIQVATGTTQRTPLFARLPKVACERAYATTPQMQVWPPPQPLLDPVQRRSRGRSHEARCVRQYQGHGLDCRAGRALCGFSTVATSLANPRSSTPWKAPTSGWRSALRSTWPPNASATSSGSTAAAAT